MTDKRPASIKACLDYLYREAMACNMPLTAHLIGAAAVSVIDRLAGREEPRLPPRMGRGRQSGRIERAKFETEEPSS